MNKKVVIIGPAYPYRGGQALVEAHLFDTLTKAGYDCHTISFKMLYPKIFFPGTTQFDNSKTSFFDHKARIYNIINSINPWTWIKAAKKVKEINPDVTLFVWWMPFFGPAYSTIAYFIKRWTKSKIVFLVENYISHENRWFDRVASKVTLDIANSFISQSEYVKERIAENHKQKKIYRTTLSVYDCYNLGKYDGASAKKQLGIKTERVVLFFGLIRKYKGLDKLIRAMKLISKNYQPVTLLIAGECYEDITYYEKIIQEEGIGGNTILINKFIPNEEIEPYFKASDLVCLPYNSASQSGILMMAYGFNKPVVVNNVGGLSELVVEGKTGTVIQHNLPAEIAAGVDTVFATSVNENYENNIRKINHDLGYKNIETIISEIINS